MAWDHDHKRSPKEKKPSKQEIQAKNLRERLADHLAHERLTARGCDLKFYYLRDGKKRPVVTVVMLKERYTEDGREFFRFHRGLALCHPADNPWRLRGKVYALERLLDALMTSTLQAERVSTEAFGVLREVALVSDGGSDLYRVVTLAPGVTPGKLAFGYWNAPITKHEYRIFEGKQEEE